MPSRLVTSNIEDFINSKLVNSALAEDDKLTRIFYHAIVMNNVDPKNCNRVQVRIPLIDDRYYFNNTKAAGDAALPWCLPFSRNFIGTPENNSVIVVALMDPTLPFLGRIFFDSQTDLNATDIFDSTRTVPETATYNNWANAQSSLSMVLRSLPPNTKDYATGNNVVYRMGIRGKGQNRIEMDDVSTVIYQNEKVQGKESFLQMTDQVYMEAATTMQLFSKQGGTHYHPVFDTPLYNYLSEMNNMFKEIIKTMSTKPSINSMNLTPNLPSPDTPALIIKLQNMYNKFNVLKQPGNGASQYLSIN